MFGLLVDVLAVTGRLTGMGFPEAGGEVALAAEAALVAYLGDWQ